jgi:DNA-binding Xre family transcriptional regulator
MKVNLHKLVNDLQIKVKELEDKIAMKIYSAETLKEKQVMNLKD